MSDEPQAPSPASDRQDPDQTDHNPTNQPSPPQQQNSSTLCQVCNQNPSKYCCPRCNIKTCSAACVARHKEDTQCSGKRDRTAFIGRGQFNDNTILSDYKFLEEVKLAGDVAKRTKPPAPRPDLPRHLQSLVYQAKHRGVDLKILAPGMEKRKSNTTRYDFKKKALNWKVEWNFIAAGCKAVSSRVNEETCVEDALKEILTPAPGSTLKTEELVKYARCDVDKLILLIKKEGIPANRPLYCRVDGKKSVRDVLRGKIVVEYPSVIVLLPEEENALVVMETEGGDEVGEEESGGGDGGASTIHHHKYVVVEQKDDDTVDGGGNNDDNELVVIEDRNDDDNNDDNTIDEVNE